MMRKKILVVDDEQGMRELLEIILENEDYIVETASDIEGGRACLERAHYDVVITDLRIGSEKNAGMALLSWIQGNIGTTPAIMMTAHGSVESAIEAMKLGASDYIIKPFKNDEIKIIIQRVIEQSELLKENRTLKKEQAKLGQVTNMIGASQGIERVRETIRRIALLPSTIAIYGESGTGKELVARSIHQLSDRSDKPFVAINCGGIPENLLESELFGHKKGAFTGAIDNKEGLFLSAHKGTLFLDEIGEMPLPLQVKLLRVLDNNMITPLGGTKSFNIDVRLVSATNRDLELRVKEGEFREDLYYRLNVIPIRLPSLAERKDDIPLLVHHFAQLHAAKLERPSLEVPESVMKILCAYRWPGNVRELSNMIERAVALSQEGILVEQDLPENILQFMPEPTLQITKLPGEGVELDSLVTDLEIGLIQQALKRMNNSRKKSAAVLGLSTRSFRYRLQKYGLENESDE